MVLNTQYYITVSKLLPKELDFYMHWTFWKHL